MFPPNASALLLPVTKSTLPIAQPYHHDQYGSQTTPVPGVVVSPERWYQPMPPITYAPNFDANGKCTIGFTVTEYCLAVAPGVCKSCRVAELIGKSCHMNSVSKPKILLKLKPPPTRKWPPVSAKESCLPTENRDHRLSRS